MAPRAEAPALCLESGQVKNTGLDLAAAAPLKESLVALLKWDGTAHVAWVRPVLTGLERHEDVR